MYIHGVRPLYVHAHTYAHTHTHTDRQLHQWLETCEKDGTEMDPNFAAGVRMGMGTFNLVWNWITMHLTCIYIYQQNSSDMYIVLICSCMYSYCSESLESMRLLP